MSSKRLEERMDLWVAPSEVQTERNVSQPNHKSSRMQQKRRKRPSSQPYGAKYQSAYVMASQKRALERVIQSKKSRKDPDRRTIRKPWNSDVKITGRFNGEEDEVRCPYYKSI